MPSGSEVPAELKATTSGATPSDGVAWASAVGATLTVLSMVTGVVAVAPSSSVTVSVAVHVPWA